MICATIAPSHFGHLYADKNIQDSIRNSYQNLQNQLENFIPRRAQNFLVAEMAKTLCGAYHKSTQMLVAEAGTGIGKSLSYLMAVIPVAVVNKRKVVISTATVALQSNCSIKTYRFIAGSVIKTSHLFLRKAVNVIVVANV